MLLIQIAAGVFIGLYALAQFAAWRAERQRERALTALVTRMEGIHTAADALRVIAHQ